MAPSSLSAMPTTSWDLALKIAFNKDWVQTSSSTRNIRAMA